MSKYLRMLYSLVDCKCLGPCNCSAHIKKEIKQLLDDNLYIQEENRRLSGYIRRHRRRIKPILEMTPEELRLLEKRWHFVRDEFSKDDRKLLHEKYRR